MVLEKDIFYLVLSKAR